MEKMLFIFLRVISFFQRVKWKISGKKESDMFDERIVSGKAWDEFCDQLKAAGASLMFPGAPRDPLSQAEGIRYLSRLTRAGLEARRA